MLFMVDHEQGHAVVNADVFAGEAVYVFFRPLDLHGHAAVPFISYPATVTTSNYESVTTLCLRPHEPLRNPEIQD